MIETLETPVESAGDVLVIGAGSAGIAAAIAAARLGARTTLVDPAGLPGGTLVSGLPIIGCFDGERQVVKGIFQEIYDRLRVRDGADGDPGETTNINVDVEKLKIVVLEMLQEAGVMLRLHTLLSRATVKGGRIEAAVVETKGGRRALTADIYIDATGDADLAQAAGVPTEKGRKSDGLVQPMTMMFAVGSIDKTVFSAWGGYDRLERLYAEISARESFRNPRRTTLSNIWGAQSRVGEYTFNATRVTADGSDGDSLTRAEIEGRLQVWEFMEKFLRPHVPGFQNSYVVWTAAKIGVRETRRIVGEYVLNRQDVCAFTHFPDAINCGSYPIDIHSPTGATTEFLPQEFYGGRHWTIPYRCLIPLAVDNLLVAGRCLSATHEALSAVRVMANTLGMGEAAGYAAVLSQRQGVTPRHLDYRDVQRELLVRGGWLGDITLETLFPRALV